jgi:diacylglycerol kinase family enzyme
MRVVVLLNRAGGAIGRDPALPQSVKRAFERAGIDAAIELLAPDELRSRTEALAADAGLEAVVIGGGDGSVGTVAAALMDKAVALGVLPLGTLNHFARDVGIPADLDGAVAVIAAGRRRRVDLAEVNGRVFVNNSSVGLYPLMVRDRDLQQERFGRAKWAAMARAAVKAAWSLSSRRLAIRIAGAERDIVTPILFVGNNRYQTGLFVLGQRPALDGGELVLYAIRATTRLGLAKAAVRALFGRLDQARAFTVIDGVREARIDCRRRHLDVALDGETERMGTPLHYRLHPGALEVLAPAQDSTV